MNSAPPPKAAEFTELQAHSSSNEGAADFREGELFADRLVCRPKSSIFRGALKFRDGPAFHKTGYGATLRNALPRIS